MAGKSKVPFETAVSKRVTAIIKQMRGLAQLGPKCENPAHAEKVRATLASELDRVVNNWKGKTAQRTEAFAL